VFWFQAVKNIQASPEPDGSAVTLLPKNDLQSFSLKRCYAPTPALRRFSLIVFCVDIRAAAIFTEGRYNCKAQCVYKGIRLLEISSQSSLKQESLNPHQTDYPKWARLNKICPSRDHYFVNIL